MLPDLTDRFSSASTLETIRKVGVRALCTGPFRTTAKQLQRVEPSLFADFPKQHCVKQLLLAPLCRDIAQKHPASRFIFTTADRGEWNPVMAERPKWLTLLSIAAVKFGSRQLRNGKRRRTAARGLHAYPDCGAAPA
jgi:hypothetical protein